MRPVQVSEVRNQGSVTPGPSPPPCPSTPLRACLRHPHPRLLSRACRQDTTQPFASRTSSVPNAPYLPELLKNGTAFGFALNSKHTAKHCSTQSIGLLESGIGQQGSANKLPNAVRRFLIPGPCPLIPGTGGAGRDRTDGLLLAKQALSQLSYGPDCSLLADRCYLMWWVWMDSNHRPPPYQDGALTN